MEYNAQAGSDTISLSRIAYIPKNEELCFQIGYLFLQKLCTKFKIDSICRKITKRHKYTYDSSAILTDQIFSRILSPSSRLGSYSFCQTLLEPPKYELQTSTAHFPLWLKKPTLVSRNYTAIQISYIPKTRRPNPIVTMGLFMNADGIPLAFYVFSGNKNEQTTLKPLETKINT